MAIWSVAFVLISRGGQHTRSRAGRCRRGGAAGALFVLLALAVGLLLAALAGAVAGGAAAAGAVLAAVAGVVGLAEGGAAVRAVGVDGGDHRFVTSRANEKATRRGGAGWPSGGVGYRRIWTSTRTSRLGGRSR